MVSIYRDLHTKVNRCLLKLRGSNVDERNLDKDLDIKLGRSQISTFTKLIVLLVLYYIIVIIHRPTKHINNSTNNRQTRHFQGQGHGKVEGSRGTYIIRVNHIHYVSLMCNLMSLTASVAQW